jgi:hypothetical protein
MLYAGHPSSPASFQVPPLVHARKALRSTFPMNPGLVF